VLVNHDGRTVKRDADIDDLGLDLDIDEAHVDSIILDELGAADVATLGAANAATGKVDAATGKDAAEEDAAEPSFSEQLADQLGGVRGLVESSIPVTVFVLGNIIGTLRPALIASVGIAVAMALFRLSRRQSIRHAINGLFGILIGAAIAWKTGDAKDFYLPGIVIGLAYAVAMLVSVAVGRPLVGWIWSIVLGGGSTRWQHEPRLLRTFGWLTVFWAAIYLVKAGVQTGLYVTDHVNALGVARLALGYPPYALLLAVTVWAVRRVTHRVESAAR
jgi:hypothetical protein